MKKISITLLIALVGGIIAIGGYKLFEQKQFENMGFEEKQEVYFANLPEIEMSSSAGNPDFTQASAAVIPGVVNIEVTMTREQRRGGGGGMSPFDFFEDFFGTPRQPRQQQPRQAKATGSGVIISPDGYIVTNNHVVADADKIQVKLTDRRVFEAKVIGRDANTDLALIKVSADKLPVVKFGDSDQVQVGEWVLAVGYPLSLQSTVTAGIVSAKGRQLGLLGDQERQQYPYGGEEPIVNAAIESFIQTDAVINRGNSGGALVNARGELIGINTAIASPTGYYSGYGFAIPVNLAKKILDDFIEFGHVNRGYIGITFNELNTDVAKELEINESIGLYVQEVLKDGAAEQSGLKKGDVITKIDGKTIYASPDLQERVARLRPGDKIRLTYKRDGKERNVDVTLKPSSDKTEKDRKEEVDKSTKEIYNKLGATFMPLSDKQKQEYGINNGVVVTQVYRGGAFEFVGIQKGLVITEVNGKPVNDSDDVESALANTKRNFVYVKGTRGRGNTVEMNIPIDF
ncbi:MAG TPA: Do family serine endopeptidase [Candidatus Sphingobacterium stercoripullorum]|nr:Do family serine endopeptidase [Candidatus Sphingobacterium stercoripullorum]